MRPKKIKELTMKTLTMLFAIIAIFAMTNETNLSGAVPPPDDPPSIDPICIDPCDPPLFTLVGVCEIDEEELDGTEQLLGVTRDGVVIIKYKGKVYFYFPKKNQ